MYYFNSKESRELFLYQMFLVLDCTKNIWYEILSIAKCFKINLNFTQSFVSKKV